MKILIAGGSGQVGKDLSLYLSKDFTVCSSFRGNKPKIKNILWKKINFKKQILTKFKPKILINCLATHPYSKRKTFNDYIESNISSIINMIEFAKKNKVKNIINVSTISVYENTEEKISEKANYNPDPNNLLAVTKSIGEIILKNSDINFINLRLPGIICSEKKTINRPWIKNISHKLKNNKKIEIYNPDNLFNSIIDTKELANLIKTLCFKKVSGCFNFSATKPIKIKTLISFLKFNFRSRSHIKIKRDTIKRSSTISINKLLKTVKFYPASVKKILKDNFQNL